MTAKPERPFPYDTATGVKDGAIVYFGWQTLVTDRESGDTISVIGKNKSEVIRSLIRFGWDFDAINLDLITPIAMLAPAAITTKNSGRFSPLDFETAETVEKNVKAMKKKAPPPVADDDDDLI